MFSLFPYLFLLFILCIETITDLRERRIPDSAIVAAILVKIGYTVMDWVFGNSAVYQNVENPALIKGLLLLLLDGLVVSLPVLLLTLVIEKLWQKEAMGGGDIKLLFVTGLYLGWEKNLWMLLIASMIGVVVGMIKAREKECNEEGYFPFGPMIAIATVICMAI